MSKVLVMGGLGSIGSRYVKVLEHLGLKTEIYDTASDKHANFLDALGKSWSVIIATPTGTHYGYAKKLLALGRPFLCEKPLSKSITECQILAAAAKDQRRTAYVVNNWAFAIEKTLERYGSTTPKIEYNYYRSGGDGLYWDVCQLLYLDKKARIENASPILRVRANGIPVHYEAIEQSYIDMMKAFIGGNRAKLWTLADGLKMTRAVRQREGYEALNHRQRA